MPPLLLLGGLRSFRPTRMLRFQRSESLLPDWGNR